MRYILALIFVALIFGDAFQVGLSLAPGVSVKNAMLYLAAMALALRMVVQGGLKWTLPRLHFAFALLIGYAVLSMLVLLFIVKWEDYQPYSAVIGLKNNLIDHFLFFAVCFYGARTDDETLFSMRALLLVVVVSSLVTVSNATGLLSVGVVEVGDDGRVQGALGEQNQYAAFLVTFLPALVAALATSRGFLIRAIWATGIVLSFAALIMTVSRGGFLGLLAAVGIGMLLLQRYLPVQRIMLWSFVACVGVAVFAMVSGYGTLLEERVIDQTFVRTGDASSGRLEIWEQALTHMMDSPWSLITGFGWYAYESMGFKYATHNHYLALWFNLGLAGLIAYLIIVSQLMRTARHSLRYAGAEAQPFLLAAIFGLIGLSVSIFFVNLFNPWPYIWAYYGLCARMAVNVMAAQRARQQAAVAQSAPARRPPAVVTGRIAARS